MSDILLQEDGQSVRIRVTMKLKRRNGRKVVILPDRIPDSDATPLRQCNQSLAATIARAYYWESLIASGKHSSVTELAAALRLDRSFVARMLRLTLLAPDIVEAILSGDEPSGLTYKQLSSGKVPELWCEQRELFGFVGSSNVHGKESPSYQAVRSQSAPRRSFPFEPQA